MITTQRDLREAFWSAHPECQRLGTRSRPFRQNQYPADTRMAWCDFIEHMRRECEISDALALRATL